MPLEIVVAISGFIAAIIGGYIAYKNDTSPRRAMLWIFSTLAICASLLAGVELTYRQHQLDEIRTELDTRWALIREANIDFFEVEILLSDGFANVSEISKAMKESYFGVVGMQIDPASRAPDTKIVLSNVFSTNNVPNATRLGNAVARIVTNRFGNHKEIKEFKEVHCISSSFITTHLITNAKNNDPTVCSITFEFSAGKRGFKFSDLGASPKVYLRLERNAERICAGICENTFVSVRAVLSTGDGLIPDMIDVSPMAYLERPSKEDENASYFELSGNTLEELSELRFKNRYAFRNRHAFARTQGIISHIYQVVTSRSFKARLLQLVWSTDGSPDDDTLMNALPPNERNEASIFRIPEWCAFSSQSACWYLFAVFGREESEAKTQ